MEDLITAYLIGGLILVAYLNTTTEEDITMKQQFITLALWFPLLLLAAILVVFKPERNGDNS